MGFDNKVIARRYFDELMSKGNLGVVEELVANDVVVRDMFMPELKGLEGFKQWLTGWRSAFPDLTFTIDEIIVAGDRVIVRWVGRGTFQGELMGIQPNNKKGMSPGCDILRISDGKVVEDLSYWHTYGVFSQLGLIPKFEDLANTKQPAAGAQPRA